MSRLETVCMVMLSAACLQMDCEMSMGLPQFAINVTVQGQGSVTLDPPGGIYDAGTVVTLSAAPAAGWQFDHWEGELSGQTPGGFITVDGEKSVVAVFAETPPDSVLLDGSSIGSGFINVEPGGEPFGTGFLYPVGSQVTLTAIASPGWLFAGWFGDIDALEPVIVVTLESDTFILAFFVELAPPQPPPILDASIVAADGQFLGTVNTNRIDQDSIANPLGAFGSTFSSLSIWNQFGNYGSQFNSLSPYNAFTSTPPQVILDGAFHSFLTKNTSQTPRTDPDDLARAVGRPEVARD